VRFDPHFREYSLPCSRAIGGKRITSYE
jgi:hypothetical protein